MSRLRTAVAEQQPVGHTRVQAHGEQGRHAADEAIDQHADTLLRAGQISAGQRGDFQTAQAPQAVQRFANLSMQGQGGFDGADLARHSGAVQAGAGTDQFVRLPIQQHAGQGAGRGSVADAHLAADEQLAASGSGTFGHHAADLQRRQALFGTHRRRPGEVGRTRRQLVLPDARQFRRRLDRAEVVHFQGRPQLARQHADRRASGGEVADHLPGHRLWIGRHALGDHAVIAGEDADPHPLQLRADAPLLGRQTHRQFLQLAEGAGRFGQFGLARQCLRRRLAVERPAGGLPPEIIHRLSPFRTMGRPAMLNSTRWLRSATAWCSQPASST
ncbi:hypothetical protein D9M71_299050 [compost metagenome]